MSLVLIIAALHEEAKPLIQHLGLKRDAAHPIPVFRGNDTVLAVTGIGKIKAATTAGYLAAKLSPKEVGLALNVGIAGAHPSMNTCIGRAYLIHKIVDAGMGREFFPDMLVRSNLPETSVTTFDRAVRLDASPDEPDPFAEPIDLVDMEASGFFQSISRFLPPHRVACLKVVSDFLRPDALTDASVESLIRARVAEIEAFIRAHRGLLEFPDDGLGPADRDWIQQASAHLKLTATQQHMLSDWVRVFRLQAGDDLPDFKIHGELPATTKQEGKKRLEQIRQALLPT